MRGESYKKTNGFKARDRGVGFIIIDAFWLIVALGDKSRLVADDHTRVFELVAEYLPSTNDGFVGGTWDKSPDLVPLEFLKLFLHGSDPIWVNNYFLDVPGFKKRNKSIEST